MTGIFFFFFDSGILLSVSLPNLGFREAEAKSKSYMALVKGLETEINYR